MRCPYCGHSKVINLSEKLFTYRCLRCVYQFEVSIGTAILDKFMSFPGAPLVYASGIFGLDFLIAYLSFVESSSVNFASYLNFILVLSASFLLFLFLVFFERKRIFLVNKDKGIKNKIKNTSPLLKISALLICIAFVVPLIF